MSDEIKDKNNIFTSDLDRIGFALYRTQGKVAQTSCARYNLFCYIISLIYVQNATNTSISIVRYRHLKNKNYEFGLLFDDKYSYLTTNSLNECREYQINKPSINPKHIINNSVYNKTINAWERRFVDGLDVKREDIFNADNKPNWDVINKMISLYIDHFDVNSVIMQRKNVELHFFLDFVSHNKYDEENFKFEIINYILFAILFCSDKSLYYLYKNENFFENSNYDEEFEEAITQIKIVADNIINNSFSNMSNKTFEELNDIFSMKTENDIANRFLTCISRPLKGCLSKQENENKINSNSSYKVVAQLGRYIVTKMSNPISLTN